MSLAALGCNPDHRWTVSSVGKIAGDNPGSAVGLGTIGYSPSAQMCVCVQAAGAVGANKTASIEAGWQADQGDQADVTAGTMLGAATAAFADNEYGWLVIWGNATVTAGGAIAAGNNLSLDTTETGDLIPSTGTGTANAVGIHALAAIADNATGLAQFTFPRIVVTT